MTPTRRCCDRHGAGCSDSALCCLACPGDRTTPRPAPAAAGGASPTRRARVTTSSPRLADPPILPPDPPPVGGSDAVSAAVNFLTMLRTGDPTGHPGGYWW